jgi:hypothetical protein
MTFEEKILAASNLKQRLLMRPAEIAADNPETGVVIENKSAYFVIRDCAMVTASYLPIFIYGKLNNPFILLKGVFSEKDIIDFVARAQSALHTKQLLHLIFVDIAKRQGNAVIEAAPVVHAVSDLNFSEEGIDDIYGDYDYASPPSSSGSSSVANIQPLEVDLSDNRAVIDKLIEAFGAVREAELNGDDLV